MHPMLNIAVRAARSAGRILTRNSERLDTLHIEQKGPNDFVSDVDRQAEEAIVEVLLKAYPDHAILGEEGGQQGPDNAEYLWIIDPLDGTHNYLHSLPHYAVSIALMHKGRANQAVIYDPTRQELFTASQGEGAWLDSRRLRIHNRRRLNEAMVGFASAARTQEEVMAWLRTMGRLTTRTAAFRRTGSAALDLAWVAAGRLDAACAYNLKPWDSAAASLLIREAGGLINDFDGGDQWLDRGDVVAAAPKLQAELLALLRGAMKPLDS